MFAPLLGQGYAFLELLPADLSSMCCWDDHQHFVPPGVEHMSRAAGRLRLQLAKSTPLKTNMDSENHGFVEAK